VSVATEDGAYGEFKVFIDGQQVLNAGSLAFLGVLPAVRTVRSSGSASRPRRKLKVHRISARGV